MAIAQYEAPSYGKGGYVFPTFAIIIGNVFAVAPLVVLIGFGVWEVLKARGTILQASTRKFDASNTPLKSFSYEYSFTGEVLRNKRPMSHTCCYKNLSMLFSLLVVMFLPNYPFGCHSNQSNSAFWT